MKKSYRQKTYTKRITPITKNQINRLRATQLKHAKTALQRKFINSNSFDKQIRQNIRENRIKANVQTLTKLNRVSAGTTQRKVLKSLFSEKTVVRNGKVVKTNTFTSYSQTKRLQKISKAIDNNSFVPERYIRNTKRYREIKKHLPSHATTNEILSALDRTNFYFENKKNIIQHNKNVKKHGSINADNMKSGRNLKLAYYEEVDADIDIISLAMKK